MYVFFFWFSADDAISPETATADDRTLLFLDVFPGRKTFFVFVSRNRRMAAESRGPDAARIINNGRRASSSGQSDIHT